MPNIEKIRVGETEYNIADSTNIAPVEMSSTSANAYAVGDMLIYNGQLYEATSAIAVGNTLTVGTNIQASKVSAKFKEISSSLSEMGSEVIIAATATSTTVTLSGYNHYYLCVGTTQNAQIMNRTFNTTLLPKNAVGNTTCKYTTDNNVTITATYNPTTGELTSNMSNMEAIIIGVK